MTKEKQYSKVMLMFKSTKLLIHIQFLECYEPKQLF